MSNYRYIFKPKVKKQKCPGCSKLTYIRYFDKENDEYIPYEYGRCDRESKCGYFLNPFSDGYAKEVAQNEKETGGNGYNNVPVKRFNSIVEIHKKEADAIPVYFDKEYFKTTLKQERYKDNMFIKNLLYNVPFPFISKDIESIISMYYLGTIVKGYRAGAVTFPFIDYWGYLRVVQVKKFNDTNHTTGTDFLHSMIIRHYLREKIKVPEWLEQYDNQPLKVSCLFGEHLLKQYPGNPVALVEAPKTAVYGTLYFGFPDVPDNFIWLAVYNKSTFNYERLKVLRGRDVFVFPDLSKEGKTFKEWQAKAADIAKQLPGTKFKFSNLLERFAPSADRIKGNDLADYIIQHDWRHYRQKPSYNTPAHISPPGSELSVNRESLKETTFSNSEPPYEAVRPVVTWDNEIAELEQYFDSTELPNTAIQISQGNIITDIDTFVKSHLQTIKANNGNLRYLPYLDRLKTFRIKINSQVL